MAQPDLFATFLPLGGAESTARAPAGLALAIGPRIVVGMLEPDSITPDAPCGPDLSRELAAIALGARRVAGVDEAGRGPLAGPVVVAAVILDHARIPEGLDDSKKLVPAERERLHDLICASAIVSVVAAPPALIARMNILRATLWAMRQAVLGLAVAADHVLVDGNMLPEGLPAPGQAVIGGDGLSASIAAASIVAKVTRDRMCLTMERDAPGFGFAGHKGYSTPEHLAALGRLGPCGHHRMDFAPCAAARLKFLGAEA